MIRTLGAGFLALSLFAASGPHQAFAIPSASDSNGAEHTKNARQSTSDTHQKGKKRKADDQKNSEFKADKMKNKYKGMSKAEIAFEKKKKEDKK
jgi:hypothetical protein